MIIAIFGTSLTIITAEAALAGGGLTGLVSGIKAATGAAGVAAGADGGLPHLLGGGLLRVLAAGLLGRRALPTGLGCTLVLHFLGHFSIQHQYSAFSTCMVRGHVTLINKTLYDQMQCNGMRLNQP
jgi:hypothetical protein